MYSKRASRRIQPIPSTRVGRAGAWLWAGLFGLALVGSGCFLFRGAVNSSPELRWWLFSRFGADRVCPEMSKRSAPLRLAPGGNAIGRFFPSSCRHQVDDQRRLISVEFTGTGYAWTPIAGRVGFMAHAGIEYRADFALEDDATYVWARTERMLFAPEFRVGSVENKLVDWARHQTPVAYLTSTFGAQVASGQLASGFTVVRTEDGDAFSLGILQPPERPREALPSSGGERTLVASDTAEIRVEQLDFLGPVVIEEIPLDVFFRYRVVGPNAEGYVYARSVADAWREAIQTGAAIGPPPGPPVFGFPIRAGALDEQRVRLPPGQYVIVIDHSRLIGAVAPPWSPLNPMGANSLVLDYRLEIARGD